MKNAAIISDTRLILFSELSGIVCKTAQYYFQNGILPKSKVAILGYNSIEYVITIYALWKLAAIPVPINTRLKESEIKSIFKSSQCSNIIVDNSFKNSLSNLPSIDMTFKNKGLEYKVNTNTQENETAVIIHTSGSSGVPKGVETSNYNLYQSFLALSQTFNFSNDDVFLASLPFYHIGGFSIINRALLSGGVLVIPKSLKQNDIVYSMKEHNASIVSLVPTMLKRIIEEGIKPNKNLRCLFLGGGASSNDLIYSALNNNWPIVKVYGSSETTAMITACWGAKLRETPNSAGKPFSGITIKILDDSFNEVENGIVGEIAVKSKTIAKGYLNLPELWNKKKFNDFYLTGDYGYLDKEGKLFVVARRTDLIVSGGENIDPREIESILNTHPKIIETFVFPIEDSEWGEIPVAIVVLNEAKCLSQKNIIDFLKPKIASYKLPRKIIFTNKIPKTELGKVNFNEVNELFNATE